MRHHPLLRLRRHDQIRHPTGRRLGPRNRRRHLRQILGQQSQGDVKKLLAPIQPTGILLHRAELPQARRGRQEPDPAVPGAVHEEPRRGAEPGRSDRAADEAQEHAGRLRVRAGRRHRQDVQERRPRRTPSTTCSATPAATTSPPATGRRIRRRPVVPRQDVRHVRPARARAW